jgi:hypothetical protein
MSAEVILIIVFAVAFVGLIAGGVWLSGSENPAYTVPAQKPVLPKVKLYDEHGAIKDLPGTYTCHGCCSVIENGKDCTLNYQEPAV